MKIVKTWIENLAIEQHSLFLGQQNSCASLNTRIENSASFKKTNLANALKEFHDGLKEAYVKNRIVQIDVAKMSRTIHQVLLASATNRVLLNSSLKCAWNHKYWVRKVWTYQTIVKRTKQRWYIFPHCIIVEFGVEYLNMSCLLNFRLGAGSKTNSLPGTIGINAWFGKCSSLGFASKLRINLKTNLHSSCQIGFSEQFCRRRHWVFYLSVNKE